MARKHFKTLRLHYIEQSAEYSDLTLICEGIEFAVHKAIVCTQSPVLAAACYGQYMKTMVRVIPVNEFDAGTLKHMIDFMYTGAYGDDSVSEQTFSIEDNSEYLYETDEESLDSDSEEERSQDSSISDCSSIISADDESGIMCKLLLPHVCVNSIADYYDIKELGQQANAKISRILETRWSSDGFMRVVQYVLEGTSDTALHDIMAEAVVDHYEELIMREDFEKCSLTKRFALDLVQRIGARLKDVEDILSIMNRP